MKYTSSFLIALLSVVGIFASCSKATDNGEIDGQWRLEEIYTRSSASAAYAATDSTDVRARHIYWKFQLNLLDIVSDDNHNGFTSETVARFACSDNSLSVTQTYVHYRDRDILITDSATTSLQSVGIRSNASTFRIAGLSSRHMQLCSERDSLVFYRLK